MTVFHLTPVVISKVSRSRCGSTWFVYISKVLILYLAILIVLIALSIVNIKWIKTISLEALWFLNRTSVEKEHNTDA